jgi:hypothetical protein
MPCSLPCSSMTERLDAPADAPGLRPQTRAQYCGTPVTRRRGQALVEVCLCDRGHPSKYAFVTFAGRANQRYETRTSGSRTGTKPVPCELGRSTGYVLLFSPAESNKT